MKTTKLTHRYEFGSATVFTRGALGTDGLVRQKYACSVHPVGGGAVLQTEVSAFYAWDAANKALDIYKATQR